ncbi:relaxin-3-like [Protopterus annectens]|uniref:relaxin-3-like n=1 Tax=Protopterus annectens TaxID=7888 RepID=UPI001CF9A64D|nr:relaxin-3-like [Protopterus annectens]
MMLRYTVCHLICLGMLLNEIPIGQSGPGGEYGVKLCGREFIRAVIFTCGGSRWRRLSPVDLEESPAAWKNEPFQISQDKDVEKIKKLLSSYDSSTIQNQKLGLPFRQQSLKELFNLYDDYNEANPTSEDFIEYVRQIKEALLRNQAASESFSTTDIDNFPWGKSPRRKRDFSAGLASMCCQWGCTKTEISTLC